MSIMILNKSLNAFAVEYVIGAPLIVLTPAADDIDIISPFEIFKYFFLHFQLNLML